MNDELYTLKQLIESKNKTENNIAHYIQRYMTENNAQLLSIKKSTKHKLFDIRFNVNGEHIIKLYNL